MVFHDATGRRWKIIKITSLITSTALVVPLLGIIAYTILYQPEWGKLATTSVPWLTEVVAAAVKPDTKANPMPSSPPVNKTTAPKSSLKFSAISKGNPAALPTTSVKTLDIITTPVPSAATIAATPNQFAAKTRGNTDKVSNAPTNSDHGKSKKSN